MIVDGKSFFEDEDSTLDIDDKRYNAVIDGLLKTNDVDFNKIALFLLKIGSENNNVGSIVRLSRCYSSGKIIHKNSDVAIQLMKKASLMGHKTALKELTRLIIYNKNKQYVNDLRLNLDKLKNENEDVYNLYCSKIYFDGYYVEKDDNKSTSYIQKSLKSINDNTIFESIQHVILNFKTKNIDLTDSLIKLYKLNFEMYKNIIIKMLNENTAISNFIDRERYLKNIQLENDLLLIQFEIEDLLKNNFCTKTITKVLDLNNMLVKEGCKKRIYFEYELRMKYDCMPSTDTAKSILQKAIKYDKNAIEDLFYIAQSDSEWHSMTKNPITYYSKGNYERSKIALLRKYYDTDNKLASLGWNSGNNVFISSIEKLFHTDMVDPEYISEWGLNGYDALIITDLIWIRENSNFTYLEKLIDKIKIPIIPMSVGLQTTTDTSKFKLHPSVVNILKKISKNATIGVRGQYTESVLTNYGIEDIQVIGCPSMYYWNDSEFKVESKNVDVLNVTSNFRTFNKPLSMHEYEVLNYICDNSHQFVEQNPEKLSEKVLPCGDVYNLCKKLNKKSKIYYRNSDWIRGISKYNFSIGSRFHGNVMALRAGYKALFITIDSRTRELTDYYNMPSINIADFDIHKSIENYYELADYTEFNRGYHNKFLNFEKYLGNNGIKIEDIKNRYD